MHREIFLLVRPDSEFCGLDISRIGHAELAPGGRDSFVHLVTKRLIGGARMKRIILLAAMALVVLAVPASASAYTWGHNTYGPVTELEEGVTLNEYYTGVIGFDFGYSGIWIPKGGFFCETTVQIEAEGPSAGRIVKFERDPNLCQGTGSWAGCELKSGSTNIADGWNIDVSSSTPQIVSASGEIKIFDQYQNCNQGSRTTSYKSLELIPTLNGEGRLTEFVLKGVETNGFIHMTSDPFTPSGSPEYSGNPEELFLL
jgi:hypothetical protein